MGEMGNARDENRRKEEERRAENKEERERSKEKEGEEIGTERRMWGQGGGVR